MVVKPKIKMVGWGYLMHLQRTIKTRSCKSGAGGGGFGEWVGGCGSVEEKNIRGYATILLLHRVAESTIWTMKK